MLTCTPNVSLHTQDSVPNLGKCNFAQTLLYCTPKVNLHTWKNSAHLMLSCTTNVKTTPELKGLGFNRWPALNNYAKKYIPVHQVFKQLHNRINDSKVPTDLFEWKGQEFILVVDYFSRYCEIGVLQKSTSQEVIRQSLHAMAFPKQSFWTMVLIILPPNFQSLPKNGSSHTWRAVANIRKVMEKRSASANSWTSHAWCSKG